MPSSATVTPSGDTTGAADTVRPAGLEMPRDEIQISPEARLLDEISRSSDIHQSRIDEIRRMIASGVYETPEKLSVALNQLLDELQGTGTRGIPPR